MCLFIENDVECIICKCMPNKSVLPVAAVHRSTSHRRPSWGQASGWYIYIYLFI